MAKSKSKQFTVKPVWRAIVKKSEVAPGGDGKPYDVLVCNHAVPVDPETRANRYRKARACPTCREKVQQYVNEQKRAAVAA